jgi:hypothetical protein
MVLSGRAWLRVAAAGWCSATAGAARLVADTGATATYFNRVRRPASAMSRLRFHDVVREQCWNNASITASENVPLTASLRREPYWREHGFVVKALATKPTMQDCRACLGIAVSCVPRCVRAACADLRGPGPDPIFPRRRTRRWRASWAQRARFGAVRGRRALLKFEGDERFRAVPRGPRRHPPVFSAQQSTGYPVQARRR